YAKNPAFTSRLVETQRPAGGINALPVVGVIALLADDRDAAQGGAVGVVGPVLDVEVAGSIARAVIGGVMRNAGAAVDHVHEEDDRLTRPGVADEAGGGAVAAGGRPAVAKVDRQRMH